MSTDAPERRSSGNASRRHAALAWTRPPAIAAASSAAAGAALVWALERVRRRPFATYDVGGRWARWRRWPERPSDDEWERIALRQDALLAIDWSRLVRVVGVGDVQSDAGVTMEFVSLEVREEGCRALLRTVAPAGGLGGPRRASGTPVDPVPRVADDAGTSYTVTMPSWSSSGRAAELLFRFEPAPPPGARRLIVTAPKAPPSALPSLEPAGESWIFDVPL